MSRFWSWILKVLDNIYAKMTAITAALYAASQPIISLISKVTAFLSSVVTKLNTNTTSIVDSVTDVGSSLPGSSDGIARLFYYLFDLADLIDYCVAAIDFFVLTIWFYAAICAVVIVIYISSVVYAWLIKIIKAVSLSTVDFEG